MEDQLSGHTRHDLQRGLDADKPRTGLNHARDRSPIGGGWVHPFSLSVRDQSIKPAWTLRRGCRIKPRRADSSRANMIALVSATTTG